MSDGLYWWVVIPEATQPRMMLMHARTYEDAWMMTTKTSIIWNAKVPYRLLPLDPKGQYFDGVSIRKLERSSLIYVTDEVWNWVTGANYTSPVLMSLRLEKRVAEAASKWWKVEDWFQRFEETRANPNGYTRTEIDAFWDFIVKLREEE